jgi:AraC-like DNA-binding protein
VLASEGLCVAEVACAGGLSGWSAEEPIAALSIVLVRSGLFCRRVDGVELVADPMIAYLQRTGSIQQIAHPCGGDTCTVIELSAAVLGDLAESPELLSDQLVIRADLDVDHRALLARARLGVDSFELLERATALAGRLLSGLLAERSRPGGPPTDARARTLADQVRELLHQRTDLGLGALARTIGVSPYHLSRSFRTATGMTLTRYRRQLRVKRALQRLADGEGNLAGLAAGLGFADQADFTRVARVEAGATPGELRAALSPPQSGRCTSRSRLSRGATPNVVQPNDR